MSSKTEKAIVAPVGIKIHELAKEIGMPSKALLEKALELGIKVKSIASLLTPGQADRLRAKLGGGKKLKENLEENKARLSKHTIKTKGGRELDDQEGAAQSDTDAITTEEIVADVDAIPESLVKERAPVLSQETATAVTEITPAAIETDAKVIETTTTEESEKRHGIVISATSAPEAIQPESVVKPVVVAPIKPPKKITTGAEIAPPVQRSAVKADSRFGVVTPAPAPVSVRAPARGIAKPRRGASVQVESKSPIDNFKPQVSYPVVPKNNITDDEAPARVAHGKRGQMRGAPGLKGFSTGPRRGVALLHSDEERQRGGRRQKQRVITPKLIIKREGPAEVTAPVTIKALCEALGIKAAALIQKFLTQGKLVTLNTVLQETDAELYALEFDPLKHGIVIKKARDVEEELLKRAKVTDKPEELKLRAPVVTIMGHVDHGKTSLLDFIRQTRVAAGEAGGITQHIGAYKVAHVKGDITFLDTPGHRAFTEMRARGANVTDVVVLVVAANDGVMPQTEEAISHAQLANRKIVVALNKIDLPDANPDRVKGQLATKGLFVEGYGGDVGCVEVSAKTGQGVKDLLDRILLEAEILELKAHPSKSAIGTVIEAHKDQGRGIICTLLIQEGALRHGDCIIAGHAYGTVRQIFSDIGKTLQEAGPSTPVLVTGLNDVPLSGERFHVLDSIKEAAEIAEQRAMRLRQEGLFKRTHVTLETLSNMLELGAVTSLNLVLKVDVQGSLTPLRNAISELSTGKERIAILHDGVGAINETDVLLADASDAIVIGFGVTADPNARRLAEERGVEIRNYNIIYEVVDEVRKALEGLLKPIKREVIQGHATVRQIFKISKVGAIAGCHISDGLVLRNSQMRLLRDSKPIWTGKLDSLKRVKDDAKEVRAGFECGIKLDGFDDIKQGDILEAFTVEQVKRTLAAK